MPRRGAESGARKRKAIPSPISGPKGALPTRCTQRARPQGRSGALPNAVYSATRRKRCSKISTTANARRASTPTPTIPEKPRRPYAGRGRLQLACGIDLPQQCRRGERRGVLDESTVTSCLFSALRSASSSDPGAPRAPATRFRCSERPGDPAPGRSSPADRPRCKKRLGVLLAGLATDAVRADKRATRRRRCAPRPRRRHGFPWSLS